MIENDETLENSRVEDEIVIEESTPKTEGNPDSGAEKKRKRSRKKKKGGFGKGFAAGMAVMLVIAVLVSLFSPFKIVRHSSDELLDDATTEKIEQLAQYIQKYYYQDVDIEDLREGLYAGLFDNLDIYSQYYTADEFDEFYDDTVTGTYCGIGAGLQQDADSGSVVIIKVYDDSPAQEAGLQVGDIILKADEYEASSMELSDFVSRIRGEEGTSVHLEIYRSGEKMEFDIERKNMDYPTVTHEMLEDNIGYVIVNDFTENTPDQFRSALEDLQGQGMEALIVDLRNNPGGLRDAVCEMLDEILPEGLILYTEDNQGNREDFNSTDEESLDVPLAVLVNGSTASASEIFAGAIQDRDAGIIIGTQTYGKGVVQSIVPLADGSAFKMTIESYYTPNGTCVQGVGITPDIVLSYEFLGGEDDVYSYEFDNQIQKAVEVLKEELK